MICSDRDRGCVATHFENLLVSAINLEIKEPTLNYVFKVCFETKSTHFEKSFKVCYEGTSTFLLYRHLTHFKKNTYKP